MKKLLGLILLLILFLTNSSTPSYSQSSNASWQLTLELRTDPDNFRNAPQWSPQGHYLIVYDWLPTQSLGKQTDYPLYGYRIYDVATGARLPQFGDTSFANLAWSSQGNYVTHRGYEHYPQLNRDNYFVEIIDVATGNIIANIGGYTHEIAQVVWHPNEQVVAISSDGGATRIWDIEGNEIFELSPTSGDKLGFHSWHPNGTLFAYSSDGVVYIASLDNPQEILLKLYKITGNLAWHPTQ